MTSLDRDLFADMQKVRLKAAERGIPPNTMIVNAMFIDAMKWAINEVATNDDYAAKIRADIQECIDAGDHDGAANLRWLHDEGMSRREQVR